MSWLTSVIFYFVVVHSVFGLTGTDLTCKQAFNRELNNDFLLGEWFMVYKWSYLLNKPATTSCSKVSFSRPTAAEVLEYTHFCTDYSNYNITQNPVKIITGQNEGVIVGFNEVKFFVLSPNQHAVFTHGYMAQGYRRINDQYVLYVDCDLGLREMWLLSRKNHPTLLELDDVISGISEVKHLETQRFCA